MQNGNKNMRKKHVLSKPDVSCNLVDEHNNPDIHCELGMSCFTQCFL